MEFKLKTNKGCYHRFELKTNKICPIESEDANNSANTLKVNSKFVLMYFFWYNINMIFYYLKPLNYLTKFFLI